MEDKRVLVYTSDKHYILAYESDMKDNGVSRGIYINEGYGKWVENLKLTLERLSKMRLGTIKNPKTQKFVCSFDGNKIKTIPFYKDIKQKETDEFGNMYKYTYIKDLDLTLYR
jgi:hypothetical protein